MKTEVTVLLSNVAIEFNRSMEYTQRIIKDIQTNHGMPVVWFLEHETVCTTGTSFEETHLKCAASIPVVKTTRGGSVTIHSPGQRIIYPILPIRKMGITICAFVSILEDCIIATLAKLNIVGSKKKSERGVWVEERKIGSVGIRVTRGIAYHGISINVSNDLSLFDGIFPCGLACELTNIATENAAIEIAEFDRIILSEIIQRMELSVAQCITDNSLRDIKPS